MSILDSLVLHFDSIFGFWLFNTKLLLFAVLLAIIIVFSLLTKFFKNRKIKNEKKLIYEYDNVIYLLSWYNYATSSNDVSTMFSKIFEKKNPSYITNHKQIFSFINNLEKNSWKTVVSEKRWDDIKKLTRKLKTANFFLKTSKLITIIFLLFLVLGITYALVLN